MTAKSQHTAIQSPPYGPRRIAWELERTAMGDAFYGNALRVAKDLACATENDRALLDRWAAGRQQLGDHIQLQALANKIAAGDKLTSSDN